jgi:hydrogenase nickel incorporation protein HypA/HybF
MHEYSIVGSLIERIHAEAAERGATSISRVWISIGELSGVDPELLVTAYETFREHTICAQADLSVKRIPARWVCPGCERSIAEDAPLSCPVCEMPAQLRAGDEIMLERIEMEVSHV